MMALKLPKLPKLTKTPKAATEPKFSMPAIDFKRIADEFRTLDPKDPGQWPLAPRIVILAGIFVVLLLGAWWFGWRGQLQELDNKEQEETRLKEDWLNKKKQAVNLDEYRRQLVEMDRSFGELLKQLPNKSEMESLLVDINQAALGRGLQVDLFKPGSEATKGFYAELPITVKLVGAYHDLGGFAGDIAKMPRIVTLNDIDITEAPGQKGLLMLSTTAKTFRYLDEEEIAKEKRAAREKKK